MHGWGACVPGGVHGREVCVAGVGHAWLGGMHGHVGCAWHARPCPPDATRYGQSISGLYASYWNAFLFLFSFQFVDSDAEAVEVIV